MSIDWRKLSMAAILADGKVDDAEVKILNKELKGEEGKFDEEGIAFLIELRGAYSRKAKAKKEDLSEAFEKFFFKVIEAHVLKEGKISPEGAGYLRDKLFADAKADERGFEFLTGLNKKAKEKAPEFDQLIQDIEKKRAKAKK